jgi:transposase-like protein DUF772
MTRTREPQLSFADLEFLSQNVRLEPVLQAISNFIDQHAELVEKVRRDLATGLQKPHTGRHGLTAQQTLRALTLMRVKNWNYRELRERIADGYTLRRFTDFHSQSVPKHDAFHRAFNRLTPATLQAVCEGDPQNIGLCLRPDGFYFRNLQHFLSNGFQHPIFARVPSFPSRVRSKAKRDAALDNGGNSRRTELDGVHITPSVICAQEVFSKDALCAPPRR